MSEPSQAVVYGLSRVHIESFSEHDAGPPHPSAEGVRPVGYAYTLGATLDEARSEVTVTVLLSVDLGPPGLSPSDEGFAPASVRIADLAASCTFHLADLGACREHGAVRIPGNLLAAFVGIALSTTRGLLIGRARHPVFGGAPFPVLMPLDLVDELVAAEGLSWVGPVHRPS